MTNPNDDLISELRQWWKGPSDLLVLLSNAANAVERLRTAHGDIIHRWVCRTHNALATNPPEMTWEERALAAESERDRMYRIALGAILPEGVGPIRSTDHAEHTPSAAADPARQSGSPEVGPSGERQLYGYSCSLPAGFFDRPIPTILPITIVRKILIDCATHFAGGNVPMEHKEAYAAERIAWCFGDDKTAETCRSEHSNILSFKGEPYIPVPETTSEK